VEAAGGDPSFQVQGHAPVVRDADGGIDLAATMDASAPLIEAGVTDLRLPAGSPNGYDESLEFYSGVVEAFRARFH
jgi:hypothetical protein